MWNTLKRLADWLHEILNPGNDKALLEFARVALDEALAQLAQAEIELADKAFYVREFAAVSAERDALRERASVPPIAPPTDQVEALARVLCKADCADRDDETGYLSYFDENCSSYMREARAAIAHLAKRPEGLPTREQLLAAHMQYAEDYEAGKNDGSMCATDFALDYLRPWLRDPVGFELDVTAEEMIVTWDEADGGYDSSWQAVLDLCRSRISPVYECKECAKKDTRIDMYDRQQNMMAKSIEVQRQGLERAAAAARAALDGGER